MTSTLNDVTSEVRRLLEEVPRPPEEARLPSGATAEALDRFEQRSGVRLPDELRAWLQVTNGAMVGPGGTYGVQTVRDALNIEVHWSYYPEWKQRGWIPVAGDGCGNYYVVVSSATGNPVAFVEASDPESPAYAVASGLWRFLRFLFLKELGRTRWPFSREAVLEDDPRLADVRLPMPWNS